MSWHISHIVNAYQGNRLQVYSREELNEISDSLGEKIDELKGVIRSAPVASGFSELKNDLREYERIKEQVAHLLEVKTTEQV